jgi:hypothetical protein
VDRWLVQYIAAHERATATVGTDHSISLKLPVCPSNGVGSKSEIIRESAHSRQFGSSIQLTGCDACGDLCPYLFERRHRRIGIDGQVECVHGSHRMPFRVLTHTNVVEPIHFRPTYRGNVQTERRNSRALPCRI